MLSAFRAWLARPAKRDGEAESAVLAAYVIDDEAPVCAFVVETLAGLGVKSNSFCTAKEALAALERDRPALIFLDVALQQSDAIDVVHGLNARHYGGVVHLMSGGRPSLVKAVERIGARKGLRFGAPLTKPVKREAIVALVDAIGSAKSAQ